MKMQSVLKIVLLGASFLFISCVSEVPKKVLLHDAVVEDTRESIEKGIECTNVLVSRNAHIAAPAGWRFSSSQDPPIFFRNNETEETSNKEGEQLQRTLLEDRLLFRFEGPKKQLTGICTLFEAGADFLAENEIPKKLEKLYSQTLGKNYDIFYLEEVPAQTGSNAQTSKSNQTATKTRGSSTESTTAFIVHGHNTERGTFFVTLLKPLGTKLYAVEIAGEKKELYNRSKTVARILHSFRLVEFPHYYRCMDEKEGAGLRFHSFHTRWSWFRDEENGMTLFSAVGEEAGEEKVAVRIRSGETSTGETTNSSVVDGFEIDTTLVLNTRKRNIKISGELKESSYGRGSFSFSRNGLLYRVDIFTEGTSSKREFEKVVESPRVRQLFERNLLF